MRIDFSRGMPREINCPVKPGAHRPIRPAVKSLKRPMKNFMDLFAPQFHLFHYLTTSFMMQKTKPNLMQGKLSHDRR
jgi:hypothetical protein